MDPLSGVLGEWSDCSAVSTPLPGSAADGSAGVIVISAASWAVAGPEYRIHRWHTVPVAQYTQGRGPAITAGSGRSGWLGL